MQPAPDLTRQMWKATQTVTAITASTFLIAAGIRFHSNQPWAAFLIVSVVATILWFAMRKPCRGVSLWAVEGVFLAQVICGHVMIWLTNEASVHGERIPEGFTGYRITALVVGLIAPPVRWLGWLIIASTAVAPVVHYYSWDAAIRANIGAQEPWITLMYVVVSAILYSFRVGQLDSERKSASLQARYQMLQRFAHIVVNTQHQVNTPLQTIENSVGAIRRQQPELSTTLNLIDRSMERIRAVMTLFSLADSHMAWKQEEVTPVSTEEFKRLIEDLNEHQRGTP